MLIDDDKKFVELMVDNVMWGNITIDWMEMNLQGNGKEFQALLKQYGEIRRNHDSENKNNSDNIISDLARMFGAYRIFGKIKGELRDRDEEAKIRELQSNNQQLIEHLSQAYIPPKDGKIGTT